MKFKVLRGSHGKGGWWSPPAPRELGFKPCGREAVLVLRLQSKRKLVLGEAGEAL